ncbi:MAG TPA: exosortase H-associated membrane protein [Thermoanaerobaculia bacterium]
MPPIDWRLALRAFAGFVAGVVLWVLLSPVYDRAVAAGAESLMRSFEKPKVTRLRLAADNFTTVDREDFDPRSKRPAISIRDLTFNIVLLIALFAALPRPFSDRNIGGFLVASVILGFTHVFGVITEVMSIYVAKLGLWSTVNYGEFDRNLWGVLNHFYRLVLMYAIAFALWWIFRDASIKPAAAKAKNKRRR